MTHSGRSSSGSHTTSPLPVSQSQSPEPDTASGHTHGFFLHQAGCHSFAHTSADHWCPLCRCRNCAGDAEAGVPGSARQHQGHALSRDCCLWHVWHWNITLTTPSEHMESGRFHSTSSAQHTPSAGHGQGYQQRRPDRQVWSGSDKIKSQAQSSFIIRFFYYG